MPRSHGKRKKRHTQVTSGRPVRGQKVEEGEVPRSLIVRRGKTSKETAELVGALRRVMAPNTALKLKEKPSNSLKDLVQGGLALGVTHLVLVSERDSKVKLRIARSPAGPTTHFDVASFQLNKHVRAEQKRPYETTFAYATPPLVVLAGFANVTDPAEKLVRATFENMFPSIDVTTAKIAECRRVLLCARHEGKTTTTKDDDQNPPRAPSYEIRHYAVRADAAGVSKSIKKVIEAKKTIDLSKLKDISDYVKQNFSDSEDDGEEVELSGHFVGRGNIPKRKSKLKLAELGPRLTLHLTKVDKGLCDGDVLFQPKKTTNNTPQTQQRPTSNNKRKKQQKNDDDANINHEEEEDPPSQQQQQQEKMEEATTTSSVDDEQKATQEDNKTSLKRRKKKRRIGSS